MVKWGPDVPAIKYADYTNNGKTVRRSVRTSSGPPGLTLGIRRHLTSTLLCTARRLEESVWPNVGRPEDAWHSDVP